MQAEISSLTSQQGSYNEADSHKACKWEKSDSTYIYYIPWIPRSLTQVTCISDPQHPSGDWPLAGQNLREKRLRAISLCPNSANVASIPKQAWSPPHSLGQTGRALEKDRTPLFFRERMRGPIFIYLFFFLEKETIKWPILGFLNLKWRTDTLESNTSGLKLYNQVLH